MKKKAVLFSKWMLVVMVTVLFCVGCKDVQEQSAGESTMQLAEESIATPTQEETQKNIRQDTYEEAMEVYNSGDYSGALELFVEVGTYEDAVAYVEQCQLNLGKAALEAGNYEEATNYFEFVKDYTKKAEWLNQIAEHYIEEKDMDAVQTVLLQIQSGSEEKAAELRSALKYALYVDKPFPVADEYSHAYIKTEMERIKELVALFYGTWYDHENGTETEITETTLGGRPYYVYSVYGTYKGVILFFGYMDEPGKQYGLELFSINFQVEKYGQETWEYVATLSDCSGYGEGVEEFDAYLYDVELWRYEELCAAQEAFYNRDTQFEEGNYSKAQIYKVAKEAFQEWLDANYSLTEQLYMKVQYQSVDEAAFDYDASMSSYKIRFEVTVNENIFDFFGMSTNTYVVQAEYYESDRGLKTAKYNVN